jgi:hypothetical protein
MSRQGGSVATPISISAATVAITLADFREHGAMTIECESRYWFAKAKEAIVIHEQLRDATARRLMAEVIASFLELAQNANAYARANDAAM